MEYIERIETTLQRTEARRFVDTYHSYIKWADRPSRKMYWLLKDDEITVGVFGLGSAFSKPKAIANWMIEHEITFNQLGNNIVYCLYHARKNAGTKFLKLLRIDAVLWWKERYGDTLLALQTFILPPRTGALYKADNWTQLGSTTGGKTMSIRTLYGEDRETYKGAIEIRTFKSGETKYLAREFRETEPKLIFVKRL